MCSVYTYRWLRYQQQKEVSIISLQQKSNGIDESCIQNTKASRTGGNSWIAALDTLLSLDIIKGCFFSTWEIQAKEVYSYIAIDPSW